MNIKQIVKLRGDRSKFKNHLQQLAAPFKINGDFE